MPQSNTFGYGVANRQWQRSQLHPIYGANNDGGSFTDPVLLFGSGEGHDEGFSFSVGVLCFTSGRQVEPQALQIMQQGSAGFGGVVLVDRDLDAESLDTRKERACFKL